MKKFLPLLTLFLVLAAKPSQVAAQTTSFNRPLIWGCSPFQDSLWSIDTTTWTVLNRMGPTLPGFTITGMNGLATDPTTGLTYIIMKVSSVPGRVLGRIDLATGVCTQVGNLGDNFSSITFDETGQLWGATGNGATVPESLYKIDKNTGTKTLQYAMGNGADGEIIMYNPDDDFIYHWSGNSTMVMEKFPTTNVAYSPTNIPVIGTPGGETFGTLYNGPGKIIVSTISSSFKRLSTDGSYDAASLISLPDDLRGLVMLPYFSPSNDSVCQNSVFSITGGGHQLYSHFIYHWGDGNTDSLVNTPGVLTSGTHTYSSAGTYNVHIETYNGFGGDTVYNYTVVINPLPSVSIGGFSTVCDGDSVMLVANAPTGTYQWYYNGGVLAGAIGATVNVADAGIYNMIATNIFGCFDSTAAGVHVVLDTYPIVTLGNDAAFCDGTTLDAGNAGSSYLWSNGNTTQTINVTNAGTYSATVTSVLGCVASDTIVITINISPIVDLGIDTAVCGSITLNAGNVGSTYIWSTGTTGQNETVTVSGPYNVEVTAANGCTSMDTINIVINANPVVTLGQDAGDCNALMLNSAFLNGSNLWSDGSTGNSLNVTSSGAYWLQHTDSLGCSGSDTINITIYGNPVVTSSASSTNVCADDADVTLGGTPAGGTFSGTSVTGSNFDPSTGPGSYPILYTYVDTNGCVGTSSVTIAVSACVGIQENTNVEMSLYPNPSTGVLNVVLTSGNSTIEVLDVLGNVVITRTFTAATTAQIDLSNEAQGVYFVQVTNGTEKNIRKVIIRK